MARTVRRLLILFVVLNAFQWLTPSPDSGDRRSLSSALDALAPLTLATSSASCNLIPAFEQTYPSTLGRINSPIGAPGQPVEIRLTPCDGASSGFTSPVGSNTVTLTFQPPGGGGTTIVAVALLPQLCAIGTTNAGQACAVDDDCCIGCTDSCLDALDQCAAGVCKVLRFPLPSASALDAELSPDLDGLTLAGPATIEVTNAGGTAATIDSMYAPTLGCDVQTQAVFEKFTVLPIPNDFQALYDGSVTRMLLTVDGDDSLLIPFDYTQVLPFGSGSPVARWLDGSTTFAAFTSNPGVGISAAAASRPERSLYVRSYTLDGRPLPPLLEVADTGASFGTADAPAGIIRIARAVRYCSVTATTACAVDADCPGGETCLLSPDLFDVTDRLSQSGKGPIIINPAYTVGVNDPVPLRGLRSSRRGAAFTGLDGRIRLIDSATGAGTSTNQAVAQLTATGYSGPSVETVENVTAYLQSESREAADLNGDGDRLDSLLRVFTSAGTEKTLAQTIPADPALSVNRRSLAISGDLVFFRSAEVDTAQQVTERVSVGTGGTQANGPSFTSNLSGDAASVAFDSTATNLVAGDTNTVTDVFIHDRAAITTVRVSVSDAGAQADGLSQAPELSGDGRFVVFESDATNLVPGDTNVVRDVFVRDRDFDEDQVFDEVGIGETATRRLSVTSDSSTQGNFPSQIPQISRDGRFVAFFSQATSLVAGDFNGFADVFVRDRDRDGDGIYDEPGAFDNETVRVSVATGGTEAVGGHSTAASISADGRYVAFQSAATNLVSGDFNAATDVFVHDRVTAATQRVSVASDGTEGNASSFALKISGDGRYVAFDSDATNLVAGDSNAARDVFVRDRDADGNGIFDEPGPGKMSTTRISVSTDGVQASGGASTFPHFSRDGRFIGFSSLATNLVSADVNGVRDSFVRDLLTGTTERTSVSTGGTAGNGNSTASGISPDGQWMQFQSSANNLIGIGVDTNGAQDVFVRGPDLTNPAPDLNGDGDIYDTVLQVFDTDTELLRPAARVAARNVTVADRRAAFLTDEPDEVFATDLNLDGDSFDAVAQVYDGLSDTITSLEKAAADVAISTQLVALTVSEAEQGMFPTSLNVDGDTFDEVLAVQPLPLGGPPAVQNLMVAAESVAVTDLCSGGSKDGAVCTTDLDCPGGGVCRGLIAFLTPEASEPMNGLGCSATQAGGCDLNADKDATDRVARVYRQSSGAMQTAAQAEEIVVSGHLIAMRTSEAAQGGKVLNEDGDANDFVLQVLDLSTGALINTGQATIPCTLPGCTFFPYKVAGDNVSFLTRESDQGRDLNGNGGTSDIVMQVFNARTRKSQVYDISAEAPLVDPFPAPFLGRTLGCFEAKESSTGRDVDGNGIVDDTVVVLCTGDNDGDDTFNEQDICIDLPNPDQFDENANDLGDLTCDLAGPCNAFVPGAPVLAPPSAVDCAKALGKAGLSYLKSREKAVNACLDDIAEGSVSGDPTSLCRGQVVAGVAVAPQAATAAKKIAKAAAKLEKSVAAKCDAFTLSQLQACASTTADASDCLTAAYARAALASTSSAYGSVTTLFTDVERECQAAVGKAAAKYVSSAAAAMQACLDKLNKDQLAVDAQTTCLGQLTPFGVVAPTDPTTASKLSSADSKLRGALATKCPNPTLAALDTCGADVTTTGDCLACTHWRSAVDALQSAYGPR